MDVCLVIGWKNLGLEQRELAAIAEVTEAVAGRSFAANGFRVSDGAKV